MSLAPHLHPSTYWEKRCELLEESVFQLLDILHRSLPPAGGAALRDHCEQWNDLLRKLGEEHPAPDCGSKENP